jgi:excisionase family DNA binding protein
MLTNATATDSAPEGFIRAAEAARLLGMSEAALRIAEQRGVVPAYRLGSRVLFDRAELVALVKAKRSG